MTTTLSSDGLLQLRGQDLGALTLIHLISGLDDDNGQTCGAGTSLSGYTEWVSAQEPRLSLGWDWQLETHPSSARVVRLGLPRTNVQVLNAQEVPLSWDENLHALATLIDTIDWSTPAFEAVCQRYAS
ncbi:MAG: DUF4902 domain-containing protein [Variovorax sp.]|jgi:hypothetical protein|nr:MAG: DUF4902 domain-containing protein [Variovorax sp.]